MQPRSITSQSDLFNRAAEEASAALSKWLGRSTRIAIRDVRAVPLDQAVELLGAADTPMVACAMRITGAVDGVLMLACDDTSGLALADLLLGRDAGGSQEWGDIETSAVVETANIIGCAHLNAMADSDGAGAAKALLPSPPWFVRDFAGAVMETAVMPQAMLANEVFLTHTDFTIEGCPITCSLVFIPEAQTPA
ncbi:MAG: chemotaxis protein CheC [Planctomycetia bacterium]